MASTVLDKLLMLNESILLKKPGLDWITSDCRGKRLTTVSARLCKLKPKLMKHVLNSFYSLKNNDLVIVEELVAGRNKLREGDIANMGFAVEAEVPVILWRYR